MYRTQKSSLKLLLAGALLVGAVGVQAGVLAQDKKGDETKSAEPAKKQDKTDQKALTPEQKKQLEAKLEKEKMLEALRARRKQIGAKQPAVARPVPKSIDNEHGPLKFDDLSHDFGDISDAHEVTHVFKFTNTSDKTLRITARGSCGCTVPTLAKQQYGPGEAGEIVAKFNPKHRNGHQTKTITVMFPDEKDMSNMQLTITSNVQARVLVEPNKAYLRDVRSETGDSTKVLVTGRMDGFEVTGFKSKTGLVKAEIGKPVEVDRDGTKMRQYEVTLSIPPNTPIGQITDQMEIQTNDPEAQLTPFFFTASVVGDLRAQPERLFVRTFTPDTPFTVNARLDSRDGNAFKIKSIEVSGDGAAQVNAVTDFETIDGKTPSYMLKLSGVTPANAGSYQGDLIVHTDLSDNAVIRIPFIANVRRTQIRASR